MTDNHHSPPQAPAPDLLTRADPAANARPTATGQRRIEPGNDISPEGLRNADGSIRTNGRCHAIRHVHDDTRYSGDDPAGPTEPVPPP